MNERINKIYKDVIKLKESGIDDIALRERLLDSGLDVIQIEEVLSLVNSKYLKQKRNSGIKQILYGLVLIMISIIFAFTFMFSSSVPVVIAIIAIVIGCFQIYLGILKLF